MSEEEFWRLTFLEAHLLTEQYRHWQEREDRRAAMPAWVLANVHRDTEHRREAFSLEEVAAWLGYAHTYVRQDVPLTPLPEPPPSAVDLLARARMLNTVYGGVEYRNGHEMDR